MILLYLFLALAPLTGTTFWSECYDDTFCIEAEDRDQEVDLYVRSIVAWDFTLHMDMDLENLRSQSELPVIDSFAATTRTKVASLRIKDIARSWSFQFDLKWIPGDFKARHTIGFVYQLPFDAASEFLVVQGFQGDITHQGKNAIDWDMPEGTPVRAARAGLVVDVAEDFTEGGQDPALKSRANFVKIRHDDGTIGNYVHLMPMGVSVQVGQRVNAGERIGFSGNTGYTSGPHLHFEVYSATRELGRRTIPVQFNTKQRGVTILREGFYYSR